MKTKERYALVTGGSRGIGRAICVALAQELKCPIIINYASNSKAAQETAELVRNAGAKAELLPFDVTDAAATTAALENWQAQHTEAVIDVVVNNAGITSDDLFVFLSAEDWHRVIDTSLHGFFNVTSAVMKQMVRQRHGRVVNIVSLSGAKGVPGQTNYSAAKGAVIGATRSLAQEVAKRNITVNAVAPGFIISDMTAALDQDKFKEFVPMGRFGTPKEVADVVAFLASEKASYITGEVIHINGGIHS